MLFYRMAAAGRDAAEGRLKALEAKVDELEKRLYFNVLW